MKRLLSIGLVIVMVMLCFSGCALSIRPSGEVYTDFNGVYITIDSVDDSGDTSLLIVTWHNETDSTIVFGMGYTIEYLDGEEWKNIRVIDFAIPEIARVLEAHQTVEHSYSTKYFNMIRSGTYRIRTEFYVEGDEPKSGIAWAEFEQLKQKN